MTYSDLKLSIGIVDLFSGPGGLGEGFSSFCDQSGSKPFSIKVSIEKEKSAHETLCLRSFLRKFGNEWPSEYYDFLNGKIDEPHWRGLYPEQWAEAEDEARCMELGKEETTLFLKKRIADIRAKFGDHTVLIGGPPCQAYSLAGRSRNAGKADYEPHKDERNYLYQQYVNVLSELQPSVFVMENVKGMLSSAIKGDMIFLKVMSDLRSAGGFENYKLFALSPANNTVLNLQEPIPKDFIIKAEDHGIPQARHRVIIVGVRQDIARRLPDGFSPNLAKRPENVTVRNVIQGMPQMRSGLSKGDSQDVWYKTVLDAVGLIRSHIPELDSSDKLCFLKTLDHCASSLVHSKKLLRGNQSGITLTNSCPHDLRNWLQDKKLLQLPNNDTRGHMSSDLARYLFAAVFGEATGRSPKASEFPSILAPNHNNWESGKFADRFRVQVWDKPATTVTSHISKDGHYFIHPDYSQCRSLTVREAARLQTFPDNYFFKGNRTQQYVQVGNAVPPFLAHQIARVVWQIFQFIDANLICDGATN